jgi:hypothetical protein
VRKAGNTAEIRTGQLLKETADRYNDLTAPEIIPFPYRSFLTTASRSALPPPPQPPMQWVPGALSLEVKRPGREADH